MSIRHYKQMGILLADKIREAWQREHEASIKAGISTPTYHCCFLKERFYAKDGFNMSIQAGPGMHGSLYNQDHLSHRVTFIFGAEIGFPSRVEPLLEPYAENWNEPCNTIYNNVPPEIIEQALDAHGGMILPTKSFEKQISLYDRWNGKVYEWLKYRNIDFFKLFENNEIPNWSEIDWSDDAPITD